jgi:hypothetical protein
LKSLPPPKIEHRSPASQAGPLPKELSIPLFSMYSKHLYTYESTQEVHI